MNEDTHKRITEAVRDAIVKAAVEAEVMKRKTGEFASRMEKKWQASKPRRERAKAEVANAAREVASFSKAVAKGVKDGIREVRRRSNGNDKTT